VRFATREGGVFEGQADRPADQAQAQAEGALSLTVRRISASDAPALQRLWDECWSLA
jgi:hypothetical protein